MRIPSVPGLPLLGNLHQIPPDRFPMVMEKWADQYGPVFRFKMASRGGVCFSELEPVLDILKRRPHDFRRFSQFEPLSKELLLDGVFTAEGDRWRQHRKLIGTSFTRTSLAESFAHLQKVTDRLLTCWQGKHGSFDARADLMSFTADITTLIAFGYDLNSLEKGAGFHQHVHTIFETLARRLVWPLPYWRWFRLPADRRADRAVKIMSELVTQLIRKGEVGETRGTMLDKMIEARKQEHFRDAEIIGNVMTLLLAGEDTTANALAWTLYYLSEHPKVVQKMCQEAEIVLKGSALPSSFEEASALTFTSQVFKEVLRLRSPAPFLYLEALKDLEVASVKIKKGELVITLTRYVAIQASNFTDPLRFWPERWSESGDQHVHKPNAMLAFGGGPRLCPGAQLAMLEAQILLSSLVRNFDFKLACKPDEVVEEFAFVMQPSKLPLQLHLKLQKNNA